MEKIYQIIISSGMQQTNAGTMTVLWFNNSTSFILSQFRTFSMKSLPEDD